MQTAHDAAGMTLNVYRLINQTAAGRRDAVNNFNLTACKCRQRLYSTFSIRIKPQQM